MVVYYALCTNTFDWVQKVDNHFGLDLLLFYNQKDQSDTLQTAVAFAPV